MADISYGSTSGDILFHILRYSSKEICRLAIISLCYVEGTHPLTWQKFPLIWQRRILTKVAAQCYVNGAIWDFVQALAICLTQVLAGKRINIEGLAFASKAILRQNTSHPAVNRLCLPFPLNNSENLEKGLIIPLNIHWQPQITHEIHRENRVTHLQRNNLSTTLIRRSNYRSRVTQKARSGQSSIVSRHFWRWWDISAAQTTSSVFFQWLSLARPSRISLSRRATETVESGQKRNGTRCWWDKMFIRYKTRWVAVPKMTKANDEERLNSIGTMAQNTVLLHAFLPWFNPGNIRGNQFWNSANH